MIQSDKNTLAIRQTAVLTWKVMSESKFPFHDDKKTLKVVQEAYAMNEN